MKTISELINKIKWDEKEDPEEYSLFYEDRVSHDYKEIRFLGIKKIEEGFIVIEKGGEEVNIPLHRIRFVKKSGITVWRRDK